MNVRPDRLTFLFALVSLVLVNCQCNSLARSNGKPIGPSEQPVAAVVTGFTGVKQAVSLRRKPAVSVTPDYLRHVNALKKKIPSDQFSIVIQRPFVVIGDEPKTMVEQHARDTVKWAVDRLKQDFFTKDPKEILDIWLFKDAESYEKYTRLLFGAKPTTPYGYYSSVDKALIMNIGTGGGTLVHELVHPFIEANFPACPPWFNEGLGSLYEQCGDVDGHIHGFVNWRLPGLQRAIRAGTVPGFRELTAMDSHAFYGDSRGTNYGQARYLCHYLQEKGLLISFYHQFVAQQKDDPTGYKTLQKVLGETNMDLFKRKWEEYVLGLKQGVALTIQQ